MRPLDVHRTHRLTYISSAARAEAARHFCSQSRDAFSMKFVTVSLATVNPAELKW